MFRKHKKRGNGKETKKDAQQRHAKKRALQRFGINLNRATRIFIKAQITSGRSVPLKHRPHTTMHLVWLPDGKPARVVYDNTRHVVVTLMEAKKNDLDMLTGY